MTVMHTVSFVSVLAAAIIAVAYARPTVVSADQSKLPANGSVTSEVTNEVTKPRPQFPWNTVPGIFRNDPFRKRSWYGWPIL